MIPVLIPRKIPRKKNTHSSFLLLAVSHHGKSLAPFSSFYLGYLEAVYLGSPR